MSPSTRGRYMLFATALLFSTGGAAIKSCQLSSWQVAGFRSGITAIVLWLFLKEARRGWDWRIVPVALSSSATLILFVFATKNTTAANAIFLQATGPLYLLIAGPVLLKEPLRRSDFVVAGWIALGMSLFLLDSTKVTISTPNPVLGNIMGGLSGATWAATVMGVRWLSKTSGGGLAPIVLGNLITFLITLPMAIPIDHFRWEDVLVVLYLGLFQIGLAYVLMTRALQHVEALAASLIMLVEPALNPIWAWIVNQESPSHQAMAGGVVILGATLLHTIWTTTRSPQVSRKIP